MKSEPYMSECSLSFASETTKAATSAPRHLLINCGRLLPRILCRPSLWIFRSCHFQPFFQSLWKTALWSRGNVECTSIDCQQEQVSLPGNSQHLSVVDQGSSSFQANSVLCFLTEMLPLEGASVVGQLCIFRSLLNWCGFAVQRLYLTPAKRPTHRSVFFHLFALDGNLLLKLRENVEISSLPHQSPRPPPPPCFILVVRWVMAFVFGAFPCTFSQSSLSSLPLPFPRCPPFLCLMQRESNGQSNCCFSPVIHMEILISLLKESKTGQVKGMGGGSVSTTQGEREESKTVGYLLVKRRGFESSKISWF